MPRVTAYREEIVTASVDFPNGIESQGRIERLYVFNLKSEAIRFSWYKSGKLQERSLVIVEEYLLKLLRNAIEVGVFSEEFLAELHTITGNRESAPESPQPGRKKAMKRPSKSK